MLAHVQPPGVQGLLGRCHQLVARHVGVSGVEDQIRIVNESKADKGHGSLADHRPGIEPKAFSLHALDQHSGDGGPCGRASPIALQDSLGWRTIGVGTIRRFRVTEGGSNVMLHFLDGLNH